MVHSKTQQMLIGILNTWKVLIDAIQDNTHLSEAPLDCCMWAISGLGTVLIFLLNAITSPSRGEIMYLTLVFFFIHTLGLVDLGRSLFAQYSH